MYEIASKRRYEETQAMKICNDYGSLHIYMAKCVALITEYDCPCLFSRQTLNVVKTLLQVRLHGLWIL